MNVNTMATPDDCWTEFYDSLSDRPATSEEFIGRIMFAVEKLVEKGLVDPHKIQNHKLFARIHFNEVYGF
jgi:hypothetical protein